MLLKSGIMQEAVVVDTNNYSAANIQEGNKLGYKHVLRMTVDK